jgi:hypothetical protein
VSDALETFTSEYEHFFAGSVHLAAGDGPRLDETLWDAAWSLDAFIAQASTHRELWQTTRRLAQVTEAHGAAVASLHGSARLLVLLEDWCGDAIHTVPVVQRLVEANPLLSMRVVRRDENEALMSAHLTGTARAIPVVIVYDASGRERGWWGPRPSALETWVLREGMAMEKSERYRAIRTWYARDRGATTSSEVLQILRHAEPRGADGPIET